jgi:hypothetical protein
MSISVVNDKILPVMLSEETETDQTSGQSTLRTSITASELAELLRQLADAHAALAARSLPPIPLGARDAAVQCDPPVDLPAVVIEDRGAADAAQERGITRERPLVPESLLFDLACGCWAGWRDALDRDLRSGPAAAATANRVRAAAAALACAAWLWAGLVWRRRGSASGMKVRRHERERRHEPAACGGGPGVASQGRAGWWWWWQ